MFEFAVYIWKPRYLFSSGGGGVVGGKQSSLKKWLIPGPEQRKYKMSLEDYIVSENRKCSHKDESKSKGYRN